MTRYLLSIFGRDRFSMKRWVKLYVWLTIIWKCLLSVRTRMPLLVVFFLWGCSDKSKKPNFEIMQDMMDQPAIKAQGEFPFSLQAPPEGTVPRGAEPYLMKDMLEAGAKLKNTVTIDKISLLQGQKTYMTYCFVCHGALGDGKGPVAEKWIAPIPSLMSDRVKEWKDGSLFHVITQGQGLMSGYASQIVSSEDRWKVVNYVRHLQKTVVQEE